MANVGETWASDTIVSMPEPVPEEYRVLVDFGGFGFSAGGICHNITSSDIENMYYPTFGPETAVPPDQSSTLR